MYYAVISGVFSPLPDADFIVGPIHVSALKNLSPTKHGSSED